MLTVAALVYLVFWCRIRRRSGRYFRKKKRSSDSWDSSYESSFTTGSGLFASSVDAHSDQRSESSSQRSRNSPVISVGMRARLNDDFVKELQAQISSLSGSAHSNDSVENEVVIRPKKWVAEEARGRTPLKCKQYFGRFSGPRPRSREQRRLKDKGEESARELSIHSKDSSTCGRWI
ncbi:uncharacterized protein [Ptychodera flava]|uniref:uncharacterized protein n=1 Tax=Ptychodera flava TaxID=63121 RepID=UPI003969E9D7